MRGKRTNNRWRLSGKRNIPAYAGKTRGGRFRAIFLWEHPRVCGENVVLNPASNRSLGTSPRMRGKQRGISSGTPVVRNIPAYAGKTYVAAG